MGIILKGISDICGIDYDIASGGYRCVFSDGNIIVEGIKSVMSFNNERILLNLKNKKLEIKGTNLYINELYKGFISVCGTINSINLL